VKPLLQIIGQFGKDIKGISNITGGGFYENIPRMLPDGIRARVDVSAVPKNPVFDIIARKGSIPARDMYNTFNMGVGLVMAVSENKAGDVMSALREHGEIPLHIGKCETGEKGVEVIW
jgi:phosphoribosylformylglycinamidine cyclo-ligase